MSLPPVHGHETVRRALATSFAHRRLPGALLFHGEPGVGKQRLALWLAQLLVCQRPSPTGPCEACHGCSLAVRLEHPDIHWYFPLERPPGTGSDDKLADALEDARHARLAEIRAHPLRPPTLDGGRGIYLAAIRTLRRHAYRRPAMARRQAFVIGEAELLVPQEASPHAANALLKLLEEPPQDTTLILTSNEPGRLLPTIRSRTLAIRLPRLAPAEVERFLIQVAGAEPAAAARAALLAQGSIGRALGFLPRNGEPAPYEELRRQARALLDAALGTGRRGAFETALDYPPAGARSHLELLTFLGAWLRDLAACAAGARTAVLNTDAAAELQRLAARHGITPGAAAAAMGAVEKARTLAAGNVNPQLLVATLVTELRRRLGVASGGQQPRGTS